MTTTKIKICGLSRECDIDYANALQPDYVGFVFARAKNSRRRVEIATALQLRKRLDARIAAVGVFVNERVDEVARTCREVRLSLVQLHGGESDRYIAELHALLRIPIVQVLTPSRYASTAADAAYVMYDGAAAGSGVALDWGALPMPDRPLFLAGGLTPENVQTAIRIVNPFAVDVSSGVETDGVKDYRKMLKFIEEVRT